MNDAQTYASDIGVLGVLRALSRLRGLILLPIIARGMGAATYGVWTQALVFVTAGMSVILIQFDVALVRFVSGADDRSRQRSIFLPLLLIVISLAVAASLVTILIPEQIASVVLGDPEYVAVARWLGVWTGLTAMGQLGIQLQRALHRVKLYGFLGTVETLGQLAIVVPIILTTGDLLPAVWGAVGWELVFALAVLGFGLHSVGLGWPDWGTLRPSLKFSLPLVPSYYAGVVLAFADRIYVASQLGAEAVGIYAAAYSLARVVREMFIPIGGALLPAASRAWDRDEKEQTRWLLANTLRFYLALAIPSLVGLALLGPQILSFLATPRMVQAVGLLIPLMGLGYLFSGVQAAFSVVVQLVKDTRALAISRSVAALLYLPMVFVGVARLGLTGGALATMVGFALDLALTFLYSRRWERVPLPFLLSFKAILASAGMGLVVMWLDLPGPIGLGFNVVAGVIAYVAVLAILGGFGMRELRFIASVFRHRTPGV